MNDLLPGGTHPPRPPPQINLPGGVCLLGVLPGSVWLLCGGRVSTLA